MLSFPPKSVGVFAYFSVSRSRPETQTYEQTDKGSRGGVANVVGVCLSEPKPRSLTHQVIPQWLVVSVLSFVESNAPISDLFG